MRRRQAPVKKMVRGQGHPGRNPERHEVPQLDKHGHNVVRFSVFRNVAGLALAEMQTEFDKATKNLTSRARNEMDQHGLAVNLVAKQETDDFTYKRGVTNQAILDAIYGTVRSLRRPTHVTVANVGVFGSNRDSNKSIGLALTEESAEEMRAERLEIISVVEDFIDPASDYDAALWLPFLHPHISLGRVQFRNAQNDRGTGIRIKRTLAEFLPRLPIKLDRANFDS